MHYLIILKYHATVTVDLRIIDLHYMTRLYFRSSNSFMQLAIKETWLSDLLGNTGIRIHHILKLPVTNLMCHPSVSCKTLDLHCVLISSQIISIMVLWYPVPDRLMSSVNCDSQYRMLQSKVSTHRRTHFITSNLKQADTPLMLLFHLFFCSFQWF